MTIDSQDVDRAYRIGEIDSWLPIIVPLYPLEFKRLELKRMFTGFRVGNLCLCLWK